MIILLGSIIIYCENKQSWTKEAPMFDKQAFHSLSYGMYVIGARCDGRDYGCVANTFAQVTSSPLQVSVALNKENATTAAVASSRSLHGILLVRTGRHAAHRHVRVPHLH